MPYIDQENRESWEEYLKPLLDQIRDDTPEGELNYLIFRILLKASKRSYKRLNAIMGVMESCKQEFYRRIVAEYENSKMNGNGDIREIYTI